MFIRPDLGTTLADLDTIVKERDDAIEPIRVMPREIEFHLSSTDPTIKIGDRETHATETSIAAFADLLQIPTAFMKRAQQKVQGEHLDPFLNDLLANTLLKDARVQISGNHVHSIGEWGKEGINPAHLTRAALNALPAGCEVTRLVDETNFFGFDVRVPEDHDRGVVESGTTVDGAGTAVGDITAGGVRFGVNLKQGLAPTVEEYLFRLVCTNGMTVQDSGLKVDARGQTIDEVMAEIEQMAQVAFGRVEGSINAFYDLREQRVNNVERAIRQIARERGIPTRSTMALMDLAVGADMPDDPTMFDVVNLVTNFANSPAVNRDGGRLILEGAGGAVISDHAARCNHCQQKVS